MLSQELLRELVKTRSLDALTTTLESTAFALVAGEVRVLRELRHDNEADGGVVGKLLGVDAADGRVAVYAALGGWRPGDVVEPAYIGAMVEVDEISSWVGQAGGMLVSGQSEAACAASMLNEALRASGYPIAPGVPSRCTPELHYHDARNRHCDCTMARLRAEAARRAW